MSSKSERDLWQSWHKRAKDLFGRRRLNVEWKPEAIAEAMTLPLEIRQEIDRLIEAFEERKAMDPYKGAPRLKPLDERPTYRDCWRIRVGYLMSSEAEEYRVILRPAARGNRVWVIRANTWDNVYG